MKCKAGLYLLAVLAAGCRPPSAYEIQIERGVALEEVTEIKEAVADWQENVPELETDIRPAHGGCAGRYACVTIDITSGYVDGDTFDSPGDIVISRLLSRADRGRLLRHRLGHAFGLPHGRPNTIMDPDANTSTWVVMPGDAAVWRALR